MSEDLTAGLQPSPDGWGQSIVEERLAELKALAARQRAWTVQPVQERGESHFKGVQLTGADVFWLAAYALVGLEDDLDAAAARLADDEERYSLTLSGLHLEGAWLNSAHLEGAILNQAYFDGARLNQAHLEEAWLNQAHLEDAGLEQAHLEGAILARAHLERAQLDEAHLERASLEGAQLKRASLWWAHLEGAFLNGAHLEEAKLIEAHMEGANLNQVHLEGANLSGAHLEGANLRETHLSKAFLSSASFDKSAHLNSAHLDGVVLDQVVFDNTNLTVLEWGEVQLLGDETEARSEKTMAQKVAGFHSAARAYRALATALRAQGLSTEATRFHYRAELMVRYEQLYDFLSRLLSRRFYTAPAAFMRWLVSWLLGTFAGYGDRLDRLFLTYLVTVSVFAGLMFVAAGRPPTVDSIRDVYVLSITSFHGRGLQPPGLSLSDALATLAAIEAFFGLAIEAIFIAAFTRRVTGG